MTPEMQFECLLVCRDSAVYSVQRVLQDFSISVEHRLSSSTAQAALAGGGHDIVVVDCDGAASSEFVTQTMHNRKKPTVVAVLADDTHPSAAHFTIRKPLTIDSARTCLKSAHARVLLEYRLHTRYALLAHVTATDENSRPKKATGGKTLRGSAVKTEKDILESLKIEEMSWKPHRLTGAVMKKTGYSRPTVEKIARNRRKGG